MAGSVAVSANLVGTVDERGVFTVGGGGAFRREFTLEQVEGEWRISNPPDGLIILEPDFERLYDERAAYFLDPTGQRVVPDPRHLIRGRRSRRRWCSACSRGRRPRSPPGSTTPWAACSCAPPSPSDGQAATVDLTGLAPTRRRSCRRSPPSWCGP